MKDLSGLQPWLVDYVVYAQNVHQLVSGGEWNAARQRVDGGTRPVITSTYRSRAEQQELYDNRATNPYPVNRPGDSSHEWGLSFDSDVPDAEHPLWRQVREYVGFRVPDNDPVHGEVPNWRAIVAQAGF